VIFAAVSGTSQAAPIAPLPAGVASDNSGITQVYWRGGWHGGWHGGYWRRPYWHGPYWHGPYWHRRCWVGPWGRLHCW
jgi:hypothetical protein